jgi:hypothetical protein
MVNPLKTRKLMVFLIDGVSTGPLPFLPPGKLPCPLPLLAGGLLLLPLEGLFL